MSLSNIWKQYGGTRKPDTYRNLTLGTVVADQVLIRDKFAGLYNFKGSVTIEGGLTLQDQLVGKENIYAIHDTNIGGDLYLKNKFYFGQGFSTYEDWFNTYADPAKTGLKTLQSTNTNTYMFGTATNIGINTQTPSSIFEITSLLNTQNDILTVSSITGKNRSIISQNVNKKGIVVTATDSTSNVDFFNDVTTSSTNKPNATIQYRASGSNLTGGNLILSSTNTNITATNFTNVLSKFRVSRNDTVDTIATNNSVLNETAIIYDNSAGNYQYNYYENSDAIVGNALSLISQDSSSVALLNIVSPSKLGFTIGGGAYSLDTSRSMGSYGLTDKNGIYRVSQTIVSGSSPLKYYSTMGINTYAPKTDKYILDVNGPVHISNGEINKVAQTNFEILQFRFSKKDKKYALAVGTPSSITKATIYNPKPYVQNVLFSKDGGNTWNLSRVSTTSDLEFEQRYFKSYSYDSSFSLIGTNNFFLYYTINGGVTWGPMNFYNQASETVKNIYVTDFLNGQRIFLVYTSINSSTNKILAADISGGYTSLSRTAAKLLYTSVNPPRIQYINTSDGYDDHVYFVGNGIEKYKVSTLKSVYSINITNVYNDIAVFDNSFSVAVGVNIISYTNNGTNWYTNTTAYYGLTNITLNSVYIYDLNNIVAVGDGGVIIYSTNGANSWNFIASEVLNSSGAASAITGPNNKLRSVFMPNINSFFIASVKQTYYLDVLPGTNDSRLGSSSIYYGYLPNVFNRINNRVLDVSGNMAITGDIYINDGGQLKTNSRDFYLLNDTVQNVFFGGSTRNINLGGNNKNSFINMYGETNFYNGFNVLIGTASFAGDMGTQNLKVNQSATVAGNVDINNNLTAMGDVSFNNDLYVRGSETIHGDLEVHGNTRLQSRLYVGSDTGLYGYLYADLDASFNGNVDFGNNVGFYGDTSLNGYLTVAYNSDLKGILDVSGYTHLHNNLFVDKYSVFFGPVDVSNQFTALVDASFIGNVDITNGDLNVGTNSNGNVNVGSNLAVYGDTSLNGYLTVAYNSNLQGTLDLSDNAYFHSSMRIDKDLLVKNRLNVINDVSFNSRLSVAGNTNISGTLNVIKDVSFNSRLSVADNTNILGTLNVIKDASMGSRLFVTFDACFNRNVTIYNDASIGNRLFVSSDATIFGKLDTKGNALIKGNLVVYGDASFNSKISFGGNPIVINKTTNYPNTIMDINGNVITSYLGIGTTSVKGNCSLDINGDSNMNGSVFQF